MLESMLMQKGGLATQAVARVLVGYEAGDRVPTVTELSEQLGTARGNIQYALANLKKLGAIELQARGHLGTFLLGVDYLELARVCGVKGLVGVMPLPYSKKYEGLATGLYSALNSGDFQANIAFMRGSSNRLAQLLEGRYDFVVMSRLACESYRTEGVKIEELANFGPRTYVEEHVILVRPGFDGSWRGKTIGVDESSIDHKSLTHQYYAGQNVQYKKLAYNEILSMLHSGGIDACIWNTDVEPLDDVRVWERELDESATQAVLACRAEDALTRRLVQQVVRPGAVRAQQREVIEGTRVPRY